MFFFDFENENKVVRVKIDSVAKLARNNATQDTFNRSSYGKKWYAKIHVH